MATKTKLVKQSRDVDTGIFVKQEKPVKASKPKIKPKR